jgi:hypothetical protein
MLLLPSDEPVYRRRWVPRRIATCVAMVATVQFMGDELDVEAMVERVRERAKAVKSRGMPPIEGADRRRFIQRTQLDFQDFAMLGDATGAVEDGVLTLRIDLRPAGD